jgi:hypothetical protein
MARAAQSGLLATGRLAAEAAGGLFFFTVERPSVTVCMLPPTLVLTSQRIFKTAKNVIPLSATISPLGLT